MRRSTQDPDEPLLFDLPLIPENAPAPVRPGERRPRDEAAALERPAPAREEPPRNGRAAEPAPPKPAETERSRGASSAPNALRPTGRTPAEPALPAWASPGKRWLAGGADLAVHVALLVGVILGAHLIGVQPGLGDWPALLLFVLTFSFFYSVVPLAFWGQTLGMAWSGLTARNQNGEPLSFDQTARRWLGGLLTLGLLGIPLALPFRGRTLSDLLSGSETYRAAGSS